MSGQTTQFIYDGDGNLVKKVKPDNSKTIYVLGIYEVDKTSGGSVTRTVTYYPAAGAMRINSTLYYVLKDHLGSASVVTDASGTILGEQRYYPFGETRLTTGTIYTDKLFTGQREMRRPEPVEGAGLGIYHYQARFYSPKLGRFLSPDTIVPSYANPQNLNRFGYVLNNPLRYIDPTGHDPVCGYDYSDPECESPEDAPVVINNPGPLDPGLPQGGGGGGNNNHGSHDNNSGGEGNDGCYGIPDCGLTDETGPVILPYVPLDPGLLTSPEVTLPNPTISPPSSPPSFFTTPGYSVPQFIGGALLFGFGFGFAVLGVGLILIAGGEVLASLAEPTPLTEPVIFPHALGMTAVGGFFFFGGIGTVGFSAMKDAVTP